MKNSLRRWALAAALCGCGPQASYVCDPALGMPPEIHPVTDGSRGFPKDGPWLSYYGNAHDMGSLERVAATFRIINLDADPDQGNFTPAQISTLKAGGQNRVITYMNVGACETFRSYYQTAPNCIRPCGANPAAQLGSYRGYPDETWMNPANADYQRLILDHVAPRLISQGVDGFYLDNLELLDHGAQSRNGPCDAACVQGGLDLVRKLRERYPNKLIVMQNGTGDSARLGRTGGVAYPTLLDGVAHEEVYQPSYSQEVEMELLAWRGLGLLPGGRPFWVATEDYVGGCGNTAGAQDAYQKARAHGFSPYVSDQSSGQRVVCYWPF